MGQLKRFHSHDPGSAVHPIKPESIRKHTTQGTCRTQQHEAEEAGRPQTVALTTQRNQLGLMRPYPKKGKKIMRGGGSDRRQSLARMDQ